MNNKYTISSISTTNAIKRKEKDVMKLMISEYEVINLNDKTNSEFIVKLLGPKQSIYEGVSVFSSLLNTGTLVCESDIARLISF